MKKLFVMMTIIVMLIGTFANAEESREGFIDFCNGLDVEVVEQQDGSGVMYIIVNDMDDHGIQLYTSDVNSDTVEMSIYRDRWTEEISGPITLNKDNYEEELERVIYRLYQIETVNRDYADGLVNEEYRDAMLFKYRITNWLSGRSDGLL